MIPATEWSNQLSSAEIACRQALEKEAASSVFARLCTPDGLHHASSVLATASALRNPDLGPLDQFRAELGVHQELDETALAHTLLVAASLHTIPKVPSLPVGESVKKLFAEEFLSYAAPSQQWKVRFLFSDVRYQEMARIATLQRFPAGQYHWELAAFPRSWLPNIAGQWATATQAFLPMKGFGPLFELHLNDRRKNRVKLLESETGLSCYRAGQSLALQPAIKGIMTISWLYCRSTAVVSPHLEWLRRFFVEAGATIVDVREAPANAGFLVGSADRRKLYEAGAYRPKESCVLWPRGKVLRWMEKHPQFAG